MSYILDALKKAESERKLGSVPNVYMEPLPMAKSEETAFSQRKAWWWAAAGLLAISGIALVWTLNNSQAEMPTPVPPIVAAQSAVAPPISQENTAEAQERHQTPQANSPSANKAATAPSTPIAKKSPTAASPEKPIAPAKRPVDEKKQPSNKQQSNKQQLARLDSGSNPEKRLESRKAPPTPSQATLPAPAPERPPADVSVLALRDLPEHVQRSIPQISIGGYIYSAKPAERSMLLNNRLVREGEQVASGLILETMMPKEAILSYQGQRFRMPYQTY